MFSAVQQTAFEASSRKVHAVNKGYFPDPFVHLFTSDHTVNNSPLMNRGYWLRTKAFENTLTNFAASLGPNAPLQVVNIGAGFDTLFFRWASNPKLDGTIPSPHGALNITKFVELDVEDMTSAKKRIIAKNAILQSLTKREDIKDVYHLETCDLSSLDDVQAAFTKAGLSPTVPTFLLAECVLVYIPPKASDNLLSYITSFFKAGTAPVLLASYDMIQPQDRFGQMMVQNLAKIGLNIHSVDELKSTKDHEERCRRVGFQAVKAQTMKLLYTSVARDQQVTLNKIEIIDDWDEWNMVHEHYTFVLASLNMGEGEKGVIAPFPQPAMPTFGSFAK